MLPFDRRPWAKHLAATVIVLSLIGAVLAAFFFYDNRSLHISEIVGIFLLLLTIIPPNVAILLRKPGQTDPMAGPSTLREHTR